MDYLIKKSAELKTFEANERYVSESLEKIIKNKLNDLDIISQNQFQTEVLEKALQDSLCEVSVSDKIINGFIQQTFTFKCKKSGVITLLPLESVDGLRKKIIVFSL